MRLELQKLHRRLGVTSLYVTHDQVEAMTLGSRIIVMNSGRAEQIGTPAEVYHQPATLFVAGFIGSPPMNLVEGRLRAGAFEAPGVRVEGFNAPDTERIVLGVRPEDMRVVAPGQGQVSGEIFSFELTGDSTLAMVRLGSQVITARAAKDHRARIGEATGFAFDASHCHLFDGQTQNRLPLACT
jgi:multiple sugar transport system ATP-binding protein